MEGLSIICAGLGFVEEDENGNRIGYVKGEHCLDNLKDLLRFLRRDDPQTREVFKQVCKWNTVSKDLIPIIEHCQDDRTLVLNAVKVLVFLTMPVEPSSSDILQQIEYLWGLKSVITYSDIVAVIISLLESPLENLEHEAFSEDDWKLVQLVLTLFRNILAVQDISLLQKAGGSATQFLSLRDRFLELLFRENVMDLIIVLTQHVGRSSLYLRQDNLLLLEIFYYVFMGQEPELIARAHLKESMVEGDATASLNVLSSIMEEEKEKRKRTRLRNSSCYSQFSGTFTRLTMDGSKALFKGNPISVSGDTMPRPQKVPRGPLKRIVWDHGRLPSTKDNILELLYEFVNQFLSGGYNVLMQSIHEDIEKEHHDIQKSDVVGFFHVAQFVMSFQYHKSSISKPNMEVISTEAVDDKYTDNTLFKGDVCGPVAATMNESMFLLVISNWRNAFDGLKETNDYKFMSVAGSLLKIMIRMLDLVLKLFPKDSKEHQIARILLYKLFYDQTDQGMTQFLMNLIKSFDTHKQPKSDLSDLVEILHVVVRLMENLQQCGTLRVSRKSRKGKRKKTLSDMKDAIDEPNGDLETGIHDRENPVDLSMSQVENSTNACPTQKEGDTIILAHVNEIETSTLVMGNLTKTVLQKNNKKFDFTHDDIHCGTNNSSGDDGWLATTDEVDFKVSALVSAFANNAIIHNLCWLLKFYKSNSISTNHYIICMLRRICDDLELSPMLYQLSLLTTFHAILVDQKLNPCKEYENIVNFLLVLVRRMLRKMKTQPLLFVEVLFWKTRRECHDINADSLLQDLGSLKNETRNWGSASGAGEVGSLPGKGAVRRSIADALGDDEAEVVLNHELDNQEEEDPNEASVQGTLPLNSNPAGSLKESVESISNSEINGKSYPNNGVSRRKKRLVLNDELKNKVKCLYERYKDSRHCSRLIAEALDLDEKVSTAQVSNILKHLGIKTRKKMLGADVSFAGGPGEIGNEGETLENVHTLVGANDLDESLLRKPLQRKKRACAFSEEQEMMIKNLFEQFKDHKRCSYMIANALDADGVFTAAQVSNKLRQLGLFVPRQRRSAANMHLMDEDVNDFVTDGTQNLDDETLLSLRNRSKDRGDSRLSSELVPVPKADEKLSQDDSEDEILSSLIKNPRKSLLMKKDDKHTATSVQENATEKDSGSKITLDTFERNGSGDRDEKEAPEIVNAVSFNHTNLENISEAETTGIGEGTKSGPALVSNIDNQQQYDELADELVELADSRDDVALVASSKNSVRRRLRVIDLEDDD